MNLYDCHGGPGTTEPACGACVTCLHRVIEQKDQRIKRLEEAGDEIIWAFCPASVSMMTERESDALRMWNKAKGDKP